jgi:UDP-glucose 4-epimerase
MMIDSKRILVTGSSGYIGQHLVKLLRKGDYEVFGIDKSVRFNDYLAPNHFIKLDITENFVKWPQTVFDTVVHLAALVKVNESVLKPISYYDTNINGTVNVLQELFFKNFVFASTGTAANPINPYALSKRCAEDVVGRYCIENTKTFTSFRFYNVIGSDGIAPTNMDGLMYNLMKAKETGSFNLYGGDYNTPDGTPVRDYVHVNEICHSIQKAIETPANSLQNLGHGKGHTVKEMVDVFKMVNNCDFAVNYCQRREGDLEYSVLDNPSTYMESTYTLSQLLKV